MRKNGADDSPAPRFKQTIVLSRREQAQRWRERAAQLRSAAEQVHDTAARVTLRHLATTYEDMARRQDASSPASAAGKTPPESQA